MQLQLKEISEAVGGLFLKGNIDTEVNGISTDSRAIIDGNLFIALEGERFDGHDFLREALFKGASSFIISMDRKNLVSGLLSQVPVVLVNDTIGSLGDLAMWWRRKHHAPIIAISGSCGKSTTKEMLSAITSVSMKTLKTPGNMNNLIGVPLTILKIEDYHDIAIIEMGISERGEMERLFNIVDPDIALITNIGMSHLSGLGDIRDIMKEKGKLFSLLRTDARAVVNLDDPHILPLIGAEGRERITYSLSQQIADIYLKDYSYMPSLSDGIVATFSVFGKDVVLEVKIMGAYNLGNVAAAIAVAIAADVKFGDIRKGLSCFAPMPGRMKAIQIGDVTIIDDTYNANPESMAAAIQTLASFSGRRIAVTGDMLELGDFSEDAHLKLGRLIAESGIDHLVALGEFSGSLIEGALMAGMRKDSIFAASCREDITDILSLLVHGNEAILFKGSRAMKMDETMSQFMALIKNNKDLELH